jgi:3-oxoacyl-[acyl-carrier-protein] synthase-3
LVKCRLNFSEVGEQVAKAYIIGTGSYLPNRILTNPDLEKRVETSDEWIFSRTGIKERRLAAADEFTSDMGTAAAREALKAAALTPEDIDMILVATMTPDYLSPSTAALIQHQLGAKNASAFDIQAACSGYLYGLSISKAYVESGMYQNVLVIASEKMSAFIDYKDRNTCVLFGDGAAASVVSKASSGLSIDYVHLGANGEFADLIIIPGGGAREPATEESLSKGLHYFKMSGKEVFKQAVRKLDDAAANCLAHTHLKMEDISWIIPHQANIRIIEAMAKSLKFPLERIYKTIHKYGNTSASTIPIALGELMAEQPVSEGEHLLLLTVGGGLTWGGAILTRLTK